MEEAIPILIIVVVLPLWIIFHYITKWKSMKTLSAEDETSLSEMLRTADRLEDRLRTMERILDNEVPDWRSRYHDN